MALVKVDNSAHTLILVLVIFSLQTLLGAVLLVATPKYSPLRFLGIPCMSYAAYLIVRLAPVLSNSVFHNTLLVCDIPVVAHCINLLVIDGGISWDDLVRNQAGSPSAGFLSKINSAACLMVSLRGVATSWEAKSLPPHPPFLKGHGYSLSRSKFLLRQVAILLWQYLFLDILSETTLREPRRNLEKFYRPGSEYEYLTLTGEQWFIKVFTSFAYCFAVNRLLLDSTWRVLSVIFVGLGIDGPEHWRPLFGSMWDAYTLRNFWGKFWHQMLRWPLTSHTVFFTRQTLRLPPRSLLERYTNISLAFLLSGIFHNITDSIPGLSAAESGAIPFYTSFILGTMIEGGVQSVHHHISGKSSKEKPAVWEKIVGYIWVVAWMSLTAPWFLYPCRRILAGGAGWTVPYYLTERLGMRVMWGLLVIYGVSVKSMFGTTL